jgi:pre-rRNA-processing protein TSR2
MIAMSSSSSSPPSGPPRGAEEEASAEFAAGVTACLRSWSALRTAVESGWGGGGGESVDKAEELRGHLLRHASSYAAGGGGGAAQLEDDLAVYLEEEFSVTLEDGSERQVASQILRLYDECCRGSGNYEGARNLVRAANQAAALQLVHPARVESTEYDDTGDEEDDDDDDDDGEDAMVVDTEEQPANNATALPATTASSSSRRPTSAAEYAAQPLFAGATTTKRQRQGLTDNNKPVRQLGEPEPPQPRQDPAVDGDGFAPVPTKRKGRKSS